MIRPASIMASAPHLPIGQAKAPQHRRKGTFGDSDVMRRGQISLTPSSQLHIAPRLALFYKHSTRDSPQMINM